VVQVDVNGGAGGHVDTAGVLAATITGRVCPLAATACHLACTFFALVRDREVAALDGWLSEATQSDLPEMHGFALGIRRDRAAVDAGLTLEWSNGQTEGFVNKLNRR